MVRNNKEKVNLLPRVTINCVTIFFVNYLKVSNQKVFRVNDKYKKYIRSGFQKCFHNYVSQVNSNLKLIRRIGTKICYLFYGKKRKKSLQ